MIRRLSRRGDGGFTLIELLVVVTVLPLVVGAITAGFMTTLQNKDATTQRLSDSHDAQITSTYFVRDVKSAQLVSTSNTSMCGSTSYLLGLSWTTPDASGTPTTYNVIYSANPTVGTLTRTLCAQSATTPTTIAHDTFPLSPAAALGACPSGGIGNGATACLNSGNTAYAAVAVDCTDGSVTCANSKAIAATPQKNDDVGVNKITLSVLEHASNFDYHVSASPQGWAAAGVGQPGGGNPSPPALALLGPNATAVFQGSSSCSLNVNGVAVVNNPSDGSVQLGNNNGFSATQVYSQSPNPVSGGQSPPVVVGPPVSDPYSSLTPPSPGDPGVIVKSGTFNASGQLNGVYYLKNGMNVTGNITSGPQGVLLYVAGGSIDLTGNNTISLTSPVAAYQPVVIWVADGTTKFSLGGSGNITSIAGTIYDPNGVVSLNGGGNSGGVSAGAIVAQSLTCRGGGNGVGFSAGPLVTTTALAAAPSPSADGDSVTLTASVTSTATVNGGQVAFQVNDKNGNATTDCATPANVNNNGVAKCVTSPLSANLSPYTMTAVYQGTAAFGPSTSNTVKQLVLEPTTTTVTTPAQNLKSGDTASFTATVTAADGSTPTGSVTFAGVSCTGSNTKTLSGGTATCTSGALLAGSSPYSVTATYADSGNPPTWAGSTSPAVSVPVAVAATTTSVVSSNPSARPSQQVIFTATVAPTPDGGPVTWTIKDNASSAVACTSTTGLTAGQATCTVKGGTFTNAKAPYTISAAYAGDASFTGSSGTTTQNVAQIATNSSGSLSTNGNSGHYTDTATVTAVGDPGTPSGTVDFYICTNATSCSSTTGSLFDSQSLASGTATSQTWNAPNGNDCFALVYRGTTDYTSSHVDNQCFKK